MERSGSHHGHGHGLHGQPSGKRGSWHKLEQTFLQRTAGGWGMHRRGYFDGGAALIMKGNHGTLQHNTGSGSLEENMRETLMEHNVLPGPQRKVNG